MRLLNTQTLQFRVFFGTRPRYAILSHTWDEDEVSLREFMEDAPSLKSKKGYQKITQFCHVASKQGFEWVWIDTCCIDKTENAELTESINSMYRWYQESAICFVFLSDLCTDADVTRHLRHCRWFTRGWTLQELLAPPDLWFYDGGWIVRGTGQDLTAHISEITGIAPDILTGRIPLQEVSVSERMSWAAHRKTTRPEDIAYCLLGIFGVNMPMIYGEGDNSFRRLQEQIIQRSNDLSILAWEVDGGIYAELESTGHGCPLLAHSPDAFKRCNNMTMTSITASNALRGSEFNPEFVMTNKGLRITSSLLRLQAEEGPDQDGQLIYFLGLGEMKERGSEEKNTGHMIGISLNKLGHDMFIRRDCKLRVLSPSDEADPRPTFRRTFYIQADEIWTRSTKSIWAYGCILMPPTRVTVANHRAFGPKHVTIKATRAIPETHWDETNRLFFRSSKKLIVFGASFSLRLGETEISLLALIDQQQKHPTAYLLSPEQHPELYDWFLLRKAAIYAHYWDDLPGQLSQKTRPWFPDRVKVTMAESLYSIRVVIGIPQVGPRGGARYGLQFEVTRLGDGLKERSRL
ncbi:heterokaryon incompatibility protein-domain-containing protein [Cladorrhinum sp. PSN332]|nr:heterokaryon incompatibility protein-domain-containing protein [Cladorrhinum sp. PSN332]